MADLPSVPDVLATLVRPPQSDTRGGEALFSQLRRIRVRNADLVLTDRISGATWNAEGLGIDLRRAAAGGADGSLAFEIGVGTQRVRLDAGVTLRDRPDYIGIDARLSDVNPARLAIDLPAFADAAPIDAPVSLAVSATLDHNLAFRRGALTARLGAGRVALAKGFLPVAAAAITLRGDLAAAAISDLSLDLAAPGATPVRLTGSGSLVRGDSGYDARLSITGSPVSFTDLGALWPSGVFGPGTKPWFTENITSGQATDLTIDLDLQAPRDLSDVTLASISGGFDADGLTVHWLRPLPPIEQGRARLTFVSPDVIDIAVLSGGLGGLKVAGGDVRVSGLLAPDQVADITADLAGPLADAIAILRHPRLHLFDRHPVELRDPAGQMQAHIAIAGLPLVHNVSMDDVHISSTARLSGVHLGGIAAGRDLDQGALDLQVNNDGLKIAGTARLGGIPAKLQTEMDFRAGPPSQIIQTVTASGSPDATQVAPFGIPVGGIAKGSAPASVVWRTRRDGKGDLAVKADISAVALALPELNYAKPAGTPAQLEVHAELEHERITTLDRLVLRGQGLDADARLDFAQGKPSRATITRLVVGDATDLRADIRFPPSEGVPWQVSLSGASLDATALFARADPTKPKPPATKGPPYVLDAKLGRVIFGPGRSLADIDLRADNDGWINRSLHLAGRSAKPFLIDVAPVLGARTLTGSGADAGGLLGALGIVSDMQGGTLKLAGRYDDEKPGHPLTGTAEITDFRIIKAPGLAKLLQAMTLYGLVEMVRGPGLGFSRLEASYRLADDRLDISDARAFNSSLGMTAKGTIDLYRQRCHITGTIVPAYFFNSLLGSIPFVGQLFSAEKGGGLFAANYTLRGDCNDPDVGVNPLSALTPGFLRGIFGIFDSAPNQAPAKPPAEQSLRP
jgi:hypothetical protein